MPVATMRVEGGVLVGGNGVVGERDGGINLSYLSVVAKHFTFFFFLILYLVIKKKYFYLQAKHLIF